MLGTGPRVHDSSERRSAGPAPETFAGRWRALSEIGQGSSGRIFLASDTTTGERVAIKRGLDAALLRHEADVLAGLTHPGLVRLRERHDGGSPPFLVLDLVDGADLETLLDQQGAMAAVAVGRMLLRLCDAVTYLHAEGVLHRDLKPGNVLIRPDGSPVLVDLGAALPLAEAGTGSLWSLVTEGYAAPEQYVVDGKEGPWTDIYGLGALGHRSIAGHAPAAAMIRASGARGEPLATPGAPGHALREAIDWALEPDAADRPTSVAAWRERLVLAIEQAELEAAPAGPAAPTDRGSEADEVPPTIRVARVRSTGRERTVADADAAPPPVGPRRARLLPWVLLLAALAVAGVAAGRYVPPLYERYLKTEWLVDQTGEGDAVAISDALARARDDAIIRVGPGTYAESLRIERPVSLIALDGASPVVAPESGPCAVVTAPSGSIAGMELHGAPAAGGDIQPCVVLAGTALTFAGNRIAGGPGPGILVRDGGQPVIQGNRLEGAGLVVSAGGGGTITGNRIVDAGGASLVVRSGADPEIGDNTIEGGGGVVFVEGAAGSLVGNRLLQSAATGVRIATGARPRIADNMIEGAGEAGIFVYEGGGGDIEGNTIAGSALSGVVIAGDGRPVLVSNIIRDNAEHGVLVLEGGHALLEGNEIAGNAGHGVALGAGSEVEMTNNRLEGNDEPQLLDAR